MPLQRGILFFGSGFNSGAPCLCETKNIATEVAPTMTRGSPIHHAFPAACGSGFSRDAPTSEPDTYYKPRAAHRIFCEPRPCKHGPCRTFPLSAIDDYVPADIPCQASSIRSAGPPGSAIPTLDQELARAAARAISAAERWFPSRCLCWVLMPDHWHGLIDLGEGADLSSVVQRVKGATARHLNRYRSSDEPLWAKGFHDHALRQDEAIEQTARYIIANPVHGTGGTSDGLSVWMLTSFTTLRICGSIDRD
jgi:REP element-mobilizing transposase RayT